jgi:hypothetical protein
VGYRRPYDRFSADRRPERSRGFVFPVEGEGNRSDRKTLVICVCCGFIKITCE